MKNKLIYICTVLTLALMVGCASKEANRFYRHSWEYQHGFLPDNFMEEVFGSVINWQENIPSNELAKVEAQIKELEAGFPLRSQIILAGGGGCLEHLPFNLYVVQIDDLVLAKLENEATEDTFFTVPMEKYETFWNTYFEYKYLLKNDSYGKSFGTGDYGFDLTLEFSKLTISEADRYKLIVGVFENKQINDLFELLMNMVDEKLRIHPGDYEAFQRYLDETTKGTTSSSTLLGQRPFLKATSDSQAGHE